MDIDIVNTILRLSSEQQTCLFELSTLTDFCREHSICNSEKFILPSIRNYLNIFKISRDQHRIELFMPFEISSNVDEQNTAQIYLCSDHFYQNSCRRSIRCPLPHALNINDHQHILGTLNTLDLNLLTQAFRVYCQSKKHLVNHQVSRVSSSSVDNNGPTTSIPNISPTVSWKNKVSNPILERGLQICWTPTSDIPSHFIDVIFSSEKRSHGDVIRSATVYPHLGVAHVYYKDSEVANRVVQRGPVNFQSFRFSPRLMRRQIDHRHICLTQIPSDCTGIESYLQQISQPYRIKQWTFYQKDLSCLIIEYTEDIQFSKISLNIRNNPQFRGSMIRCQPLFLPECLLITYKGNYSIEHIRKVLSEILLFHVKLHPGCAVVHFYSNVDLQRAMQIIMKTTAGMMPIYIGIFSEKHLTKYLEQRRLLSPPPPPPAPVVNRPETASSGDDLNDLPSDFDIDDLLIDDDVDNNNGDLEYLRSAAKNLMTSLNDMEAANASSEQNDAPHPILYADDYTVMIKNRRFAVAFLDYTQFRVEKQRNSDRFRLLSSLRRATNEKQANPSNNEENSSNKKKRPKRQKKIN